MCSKVILTLALIATVSMPLARSLKCLTCYDVKSCKYPTQLQCDSQLANATRDVLASFYNDVKYLNSTDFSCLVGRHVENNKTLVDLRGCIMTGTVDCQSYAVMRNMKPTKTVTQHTCNECKKDLCNSVATMSSSVLTAIALLVLAKVFGL